MNFIDFILMTVILAGSGYLFYRSFWKKGGGCAACHLSQQCEIKGIKNNCT